MYKFDYKKNLGQNFLQDKNIIDKIVNAPDYGDNNLVIEIGPGAGALTKELLKKVDRAILYEVDTRLEKILNKELSTFVNYELIFDDFLNRDVNKAISKYDFDNFNIACYGFKIKDDIKSKIKAHFISYENSNKNNGFSLLQLNPELSYKMAANIILDAYDSGADFMVVNQAKDFYMFDTCSKKLMQSSGREFKDFYVLSYFEFLSLIQGIKNPSLQNHDLKVSLI